MLKIYEGKLDGKGLRFGIVVSRFNDAITTRLLEGAIDCLKRHNVSEEDIHIIWVPGAFEIPVTLKRVAASSRFDALIALACIIRGETPHFDYVAAEVAKGIAQVSLKEMTPISFGVVTADSLEQAINRAGAKNGNKGFQAAMSALEMASLFSQLS
ncbi:MAG: 6,7-dimethyl-8-ribityllumazine synthase [Actinobacteria bacterium]|nr:6,7-dimethyl-8-ribityllumazine synthase [Actinomycetota bacterium]